MPLATSAAPSTVSAITAALWPLRPAHAFARSTAPGVPVRGERVAEERELEQYQHHQVESGHRQDGGRHAQVLFLDVSESRQVGVAGQGQHGSDDKRGSRRALEESSLPARRA
jgi:hypothetical protein